MVQTIAKAIATFEGFFISDSVAARNNNPGNLRTWGDRPTRDGFAVFNTAADGWAALYRQVELNISRGLSLREFFGGKTGVYPGYAPAVDENDPGRYAAYVAGRTGLPIDVPIQAAVSLVAAPSKVLPVGVTAAAIAALIGVVLVIYLLF